MKKISNIKNKKNENIFVETYVPNNMKSTIIFCHGITGCRKGRTTEDSYFQELAMKLMELNYKVILFDFSGHGDSEGNDYEVSLTKSTDELSKVIEQEVYDKNNLNFLAFSYGATVLCNYLSKNNKITPRKIVLYSPCLYPLEACFLNSNSLFGKDIVPKYEDGSLEHDGYAEIKVKKFHLGKKMIDECKLFKPDYLSKFSANILCLSGSQDMMLNTKYNDDFCKKYNIKNIYLDASHSLFEKKEDAFNYTINYFEKEQEKD